MNRNTQTEALILTIRTTGEENRLATFLTPENGIVQAVLYGGAKSRLRSLVSPFHSGTIWLYTDTRRNSTKITDFDVRSFRPTLREQLYKNWAASLCCELLLKTQASGSQFFVLANGFLDGLELAGEKECKTGTLRFLWRYQFLSGLQPDTESCCLCGNPLQGRSGTYSVQEHGFMCPSCAGTGRNQSPFTLSAEALSYLTGVSTLPPKESRAVALSEESYALLSGFLFFLTERLAEGRLKTLETSSLFH